LNLPLPHSADQPQASVYPRPEYGARLSARRASFAAVERQHRLVGNVRMIVFLAGAAMAVAALVRGGFSPWWLVVPVIVLVALGRALEHVEARRLKVSRAIEFYERGLARLDGQWATHGATGARFLDDHHLYAKDLDIFGDRSLFELLCAARTRTGEDTLASWLLHPAPPDTVRARQQAVQEIAPRLDLREDLALAGENARPSANADRLIAWGEGPPIITASLFRAVAWGLSAAGALAIIAGITYLMTLLGLLELPESVLVSLRVYVLTVAAVCLVVNWRFKGRTDRITRDVGTASYDLGLLRELLQRLEAEPFTSPYLAALRAELGTDTRPASSFIAQLHRLVELMDLGRNQVGKWIGVLLLLHLHVSYAVEDWRRTSGRAIARWLHVVGEMEATASLATFSDEHRDYAFPELVADSPLFEADALAHPLIESGRVVPNDVRLGERPQVLIVSGSNMSGKSTLLRTIGVNAVLAQAGSPVCGRRLRLSPLTVGASIRIQDSLQEGTSRFYAEISRLSQIMESARRHPPVLFLIDEALHGTNSHDRLIGAEAIVSGLVARGAIGLITTHDLALTEIATVLGARGVNVHFQDYLENGRLRFDYRMRPGVVQHSNALELMRSVGLEV
jgi:hypothetical protein